MPDRVPRQHAEKGDADESGRMVGIWSYNIECQPWLFSSWRMFYSILSACRFALPQKMRPMMMLLSRRADWRNGHHTLYLNNKKCGHVRED